MKNEAKAKDEFDKRIKETKRKAIEENIKLAEKSGNKLTQTLNEDGNLVGVRELVDFESREVADGVDPMLQTVNNIREGSAAADIRSELENTLEK
jgi:hypothetical protein